MENVLKVVRIETGIVGYQIEAVLEDGVFYVAIKSITNLLKADYQNDPIVKVYEVTCWVENQEGYDKYQDIQCIVLSDFITLLIGAAGAGNAHAKHIVSSLIEDKLFIPFNREF